MKYVDASAVLRLLFGEDGPTVPIVAGEALVSSCLVEVETFRAVDRERLLGHLSDRDTATKRQELVEILARMDILAIDATVIRRASDPFAVNVRALDAIHVATAEILRADSGETLDFWTHDERQATAALSRGIPVRGI